MPIIKRYPNRKLYNTQTKRYITLQGVAELICQGEEVQVIDHASNEDLSALTLTQILFELEKKHSGFLPHTILANLIQASGDRLGILQRYLTSQIGLSHPVDDEIKRRVQILIHHGELAEQEGKRLLEKLVNLGLHGRSLLLTPWVWEIEQVLERRNIPTREDLESILAQLDMLSSELDKLSETQK